MIGDATQRFSNRVDDYVRYRPGYPAAVVTALREHGGLGPASVVADIGSGTGIFTQVLLATGATVYAVEPNTAMRTAGEAALSGEMNFRSVFGTAEATGLADASVDIITAAQAFHWFDLPATRREFARILRPGGVVALIWNERLSDATPFLAGYEALLHRYATDYAQVDHRRIDATAITAFFAPMAVTTLVFPNCQTFDLAGVRGRLLSSSYAPQAGDPRHDPMLAELERLFQTYHIAGKVDFLYTTYVHIGTCG